MALGRRSGVEEGLWVPTTELPRSPGHPFYERVNRVLREAGFDRFVEDLCRPHYAAAQGRPSKIATAIARELTGFVWDIARQATA